MSYTPAQLDRAADYLAGCANADGEISGGYNWRTLAEIAGEDPAALSSGLGLFKSLREAGRLEDLPCIPGTYGHHIFRIVPATSARQPSRDDRAAQLVQLQLASPMRPCGGRTQGTGGLALFDHAHQPRLF